MASIGEVQAALAQLQADVTAETDVNRSAVALITGLGSQITDLKAELEAAIAGNGDLTGVLASVTAMQGSLEAATPGLAAAVAANTPGAGPTP